MTTIYPIQPYFVLHADNAYLKHLYDTATIAHFYRFTARTIEDTFFAVPDGSVDLLFALNPEHPQAWLMGSTNNPMPETVFTNGGQYFGIRYHFGMMPDAFGITPGEIVNRGVSLAEIFPHAEELCAKLLSATDFAAQIQVFLALCHDNYNHYQAPLCQSVMQLLLAHAGNIAIRQLSDITGYSARSIHHSFSDYYGISPKKFARIIRYQHALSLLTQCAPQSLTDIAFQLDYSDQSHFLRDFKAHNFLGPSKFLKIIHNTQYASHIVLC